MTHIIDAGIDKDIFLFIPVQQRVQSDRICSSDPDESRQQTFRGIQQEDVHDDARCPKFSDTRKDGGFGRTLARRGIRKRETHEYKLHDSVIVLTE